MFNEENKRFTEDFNGVLWDDIGKSNPETVSQIFNNELQEKASKKFVPIGTIIGIRGDKLNKYMVIGFNYEDKRDYIACLYPYGIGNSDSKFISFNHDDIERIYYIGYFDLKGRGYQELLIGEKKDR